MCAEEQVVDPEHLVHEHDDPEHQLVRDFAGFVPERLLGQQGTGPASGEFQRMQDILRRTPLLGAGLALVSSSTGKTSRR